MSDPDFGNFSARSYLEEYYSSWDDDEGNFLMAFFHEAYSRIGHMRRLLEIGGGPTIYQLISASRKVDEIVFSDFLEENRNEVKKWVFGEPEAFNWDECFEAVLRLEHREVNKQAVEDKKSLLRGKIKSFVKCDIFQEKPIGDFKVPFDVVSVNFCPESIDDGKEAFLLAMDNIAGLVKPNGWLVMTLLKKGRFYTVGNHVFPVFPVDEDLMSEVLKERGFKEIQMSSINTNPEYGYDALLAISALKKI